jgi:conjugal transfer pilus assembly protein TraE
MNPHLISIELEARAGISKALQLLLVGSVGTNLVLAVALILADRTHREVLVPPEITRTFWVEGNKASSSYLEQMGLFILRTAFDISPVSAEYQMRTLLKYVAPASYGAMESHLLEQVKRVQQNNVSTFFSPTGASVDEVKQRVRFNGVLKTLMGDRTVSEVPKLYELAFVMSNGRIYLTEIGELDEQGKPVAAAATYGK